MNGEAEPKSNNDKVDIRSYIESGILEAYVLDALDVFERAEVEAYRSQYPEVAAEIAAIEEAMRMYVEQYAETPPARMQERIWGAISSGPAEKATDTPNTSAAMPYIVAEQKRMQYNWANAAMLLVLIGSLAVNVLFWVQNKNGKTQLAAIKGQMEEMQQQQTEMVAALDVYKREKDMMADSAMQSVQMKSMVPGHPMVATVYWNKNNGDAYLSMQKLPPPEEGKQYQMWVIQDGKPVSMGVLPLDMAEGKVAKLPMEVKDGQAFAISLETMGGNPTPTQVYVLGAV